MNANDATLHHASTHVVGRCHSRNYIFLYDMDGLQMNARQEICRLLQANNTKLLAAQVEYMSNEDKYKAQSIYEEVVKTVMLYKDYEDDEIEEFFEAIDFELAEQFLIPRKRRDDNRFTLAAANVIKDMILAGEITKLEKADGEIIDCNSTKYNLGEHQSFYVGGYYYENDLSNVGIEANINDIIDIPIKEERKLFKERFNSLYRTGFPCFYIDRGRVFLVTKTNAIEMKEGVYPIDMVTDNASYTTANKMTFKEASIQLGECNVIDDVQFGHESAANIILLMIRLKLCKGNLMFGSEEYLGQLYNKYEDHYIISTTDDTTMQEVKVVNGKLQCNKEEFSNFSSLVDFELFTKLYSMRYMKG